MADSEIQTPEPWGELVLAGEYPTLDQAHDHGLVILAMGEACWVLPDQDGRGFKIFSEPAAGPRVRDELEIYAGELEEMRRQKDRPEWFDPFHYAAGWEIMLLWMVTLLAVFYFQGQDFTVVNQGASSSLDLIDHHEWWRPITAQFFHADLQHLVGNLLSGAIFGSLVSRTIGPVRGWLLILFGGAMGNLLTALVRYPEAYHSIGASTAVFGALGILSGSGFSESLHHQWRRSWMKAAAPVIAGLILLSWLGGGTGSSNTDVLGHAFGFGAGLVCGLLNAEIRCHSTRNPLSVG